VPALGDPFLERDRSVALKTRIGRLVFRASADVDRHLEEVERRSMHRALTGRHRAHRRIPSPEVVRGLEQEDLDDLPAARSTIMSKPTAGIPSGRRPPAV